MTHPMVRNTRKVFLDALDEFVDARIAYLDSCSQVEALEYRLRRPDIEVVGGADVLEDLRKNRHEKEKVYKKKRHNLSKRLDGILDG